MEKSGQNPKFITSNPRVVERLTRNYQREEEGTNKKREERENGSLDDAKKHMGTSKPRFPKERQERKRVRSQTKGGRIGEPDRQKGRPLAEEWNGK